MAMELDWIHLIRDKDQWRDLMSMIINIPLP
jgi:hypothetical protein